VRETLPWSWYTDPEALRLEQNRIFRSAWQYVGHAGRLPEPGSFFTAAIGLTPIVVTRAQDGDLRAFVNVCRHRGFPVAQGDGQRATLQCAYHAWTYALDGRLLGAPRSDAEPDFDAGALGLVPARLETWGPFVFVNPSADATPLATALGEVPERVAELLDVDELEFRLHTEWELEANWKVVCENFLECYHCAVAHPGFSSLVDVSPDAYRLRASGLVSSQFGATREGDGHSQFHFLWPNTGINIFPGEPNLSIGPINPAGPGRTARFLDYFFTREADEAWVSEFLDFDDEVGREDRVLVEGVQRGLAAGIPAAGTVLERGEELVVHFQALTAAALNGAFSSLTNRAPA
jgi:phenylpropionate dioxygenase-like ring-hydroxylating dioxygenase large terminal subunit